MLKEVSTVLNERVHNFIMLTYFVCDACVLCKAVFQTMYISHLLIMGVIGTSTCTNCTHYMPYLVTILDLKIWWTFTVEAYVISKKNDICSSIKFK